MKGLSRDICNSDIVLLTGAGASAPLGLRLMTSFMDLLEEEVRDRSPKLMALLRGIYTDKHSKNEGARRDLELLLERLEEYDKFNELVQKDVNLQQRFQGIGVYQEFASLANELDKLTRDLIFKHYSEIDNKEVSRLYTDFLNILVNNNGGRFLPIFTTNL